MMSSSGEITMMMIKFQRIIPQKNSSKRKDKISSFSSIKLSLKEKRNSQAQMMNFSVLVSKGIRFRFLY